LAEPVPPSVVDLPHLTSDITATTKIMMAKSAAKRTKWSCTKELFSAVNTKSRTEKKATTKNAAVASRHTLSIIKSPLKSLLDTEA